MTSVESGMKGGGRNEGPGHGVKRAREKSDGASGAHLTGKRKSMYVDLSACQSAANLWDTFEKRPICQGDFIINTGALCRALSVPLPPFPSVSHLPALSLHSDPELSRRARRPVVVLYAGKL